MTNPATPTPPSVFKTRMNNVQYKTRAIRMLTYAVERMAAEPDLPDNVIAEIAALLRLIERGLQDFCDNAR